MAEWARKVCSLMPGMNRDIRRCSNLLVRGRGRWLGISAAPRTESLATAKASSAVDAEIATPAGGSTLTHIFSATLTVG